MTEISGTVEDTAGNAISGATVYLIRTSDFTLQGATTTDASGEYRFGGLTASNEYHVAASYNDGSTDYGGQSFPFVAPYTPTGPIDDFNDGDINEYSEEVLSFDVQAGTVYEGGNALEMGNDDGKIHRIISTSGLPRYPGVGDAFSFRVRFDGSVSKGAMDFGLQDSSNYYRAMVAPDNGEIRIVRWESSGGTIIASADVSVPINEWNEAVVDWGDASAGDPITLTLRDESGAQLAQCSATDGTFGSGGIAWNGQTYPYTSDSVYFDIAQLTSVSGAPTVITLQPTNVSPSGATLEGELDALGNDTEADVYFAWRENGASTFNETVAQTLTSPGTFDHEISNLAAGNDYEYKAVGENASGRAEGSLVTFSTPTSPVTSMFTSPIYQFWAGGYGGGDGDSPFPLPEVLGGLNDAASVNTPTFRDGLADGSGNSFDAADYDGSSDGHDWTADSQLPTGNESFSIVATVFFQSGTSSHAVLGWGPRAGDPFRDATLLRMEGNDGGKAALEFYGIAVPQAGSNLAGSWVTIGGSWDGTDYAVYANGTDSVTTGTLGDDMRLSDGENSIGYRKADGSFYADGFIAEVIVSDTAEPAQAFEDYHNDRLG